MAQLIQDMTKKTIKQVSLESSEYAAIGDRAVFEMYQAFMAGYVKRINDATFGVTIGGVRVGSAKYTRLAQINLRTRIITFSRFAVENVPERGRRYLVLHELAHVLEHNHTKKFWQYVENYEPDYLDVRNQLQRAFVKNVREEKQKRILELLKNPVNGQIENSAKILGSRLMNNKSVDSLLLDRNRLKSTEEASDTADLEWVEDDVDE